MGLRFEVCGGGDGRYRAFEGRDTWTGLAHGSRKRSGSSDSAALTSAPEVRLCGLTLSSCSGGNRGALRYTHANEHESLARTRWSTPKRAAASLRRGMRAGGGGQRRGVVIFLVEPRGNLPVVGGVDGEDDATTRAAARGHRARARRDRERVESRA